MWTARVGGRGFSSMRTVAWLPPFHSPANGVYVTRRLVTQPGKVYSLEQCLLAVL